MLAFLICTISFFSPEGKRVTQYKFHDAMFQYKRTASTHVFITPDERYQVAVPTSQCTISVIRPKKA